MPSSTSTVWVRIGDIASGLPAIAAIPTAIMAPEINPPGRCAHRNSAPPAAPMTSVSSTFRVLARLGTADATIAGRRLTPCLCQIPARAANASARSQRCGHCGERVGSVGKATKSPCFVGQGLLAVLPEFLALFAMKPLLVGLSGALEIDRGLC